MLHCRAFARSRLDCVKESQKQEAGGAGEFQPGPWRAFGAGNSAAEYRREWDKTYRQLFCHARRCSLSSFERRVFWHCLYRPSWPIALLIHIFNPRYFDGDKNVIQRLGDTKNDDDFLNEVISYQRRTRLEIGTWRVKWRIRISGQRLLELKDEIIRKDESLDN
jgi:hypothetical protein